MIVDCISDLHGHFPNLDGGDLLLVAGDLTAHDQPAEYLMFMAWLAKTPYRKRIVICGNHDALVQKVPYILTIAKADFEYLQDSGTEFEGLKIWGSPWTKSFEGMNPQCKAFTLNTDMELAEKWSLIPDDTDILITHSPAYGNFDFVEDYDSGHIKSVGSISLFRKVTSIDPKLFVFGHIHESYGFGTRSSGSTIFCNASQVNEHYKHVNKPIRVIL